VSKQKKVNKSGNSILPSFLDIPVRCTSKTTMIIFGYQYYATLWLGFRNIETLNNRYIAPQY
jgi:hypothetical protein